MPCNHRCVVGPDAGQLVYFAQQGIVHVGIGAAGRDVQYVDARRTQFAAQRLAESIQRKLAAAVHRLPRETDRADDGSDVENGGRRLLSEHRQ